MSAIDRQPTQESVRKISGRFSDVRAQLAKTLAIYRVDIKKSRGSPTPSVGLDLNVSSLVVLQNLLELFRFALAIRVPDDFNSAPFGNFILPGGEVIQRQMGSLPAMRRQQFRHPLRVPRRTIAP